MLNFEDEMKAVGKGYVVMSLEEYDALRDQVAAANMRAYEVEQTSKRRMSELLRVFRKTYGDHSIEVEFNESAVRRLAIEVMHETFSDEELFGYTVKEARNMTIYDVTLATYKPDPVTVEE